MRIAVRSPDLTQFEIEMEILMPGSRDAQVPTLMTRQQRNPRADGDDEMH